jgi:hypothetical protein
VAAHAERTRANSSAVSFTGLKAALNSAACSAASAGVRVLPEPPMITGGCGACTGLGRAGESTIV